MILEIKKRAISNWMTGSSMQRLILRFSMRSSEWISLPKERGRPPQKTGPLSEEGEQNPGDKKGPEGPEQEPDDLPSGEEEGPSSAPCQETIPSLFPKKKRGHLLRRL